jgi:hypothetical protein
VFQLDETKFENKYLFWYSNSMERNVRMEIINSNYYMPEETMFASNNNNPQKAISFIALGEFEDVTCRSDFI